MRALILPGLDGCADLRREFVAALGSDIEATVVDYPKTAALGYDELADRAWERLPHGEDFMLVGESFSGPIAIKLAARRPEGLAGLVLCASFARTPIPMAAWLGRLAPVLPLRAMPMPLVMHAMMGRWATPDWKRRLREAIEGLAPPVLRRRVTEVMSADATHELADVRCPVLCIEASSDRLLLLDTWKAVVRARSRATRVVVEGPHMLLQANPYGCTTAIRSWLRAL